MYFTNLPHPRTQNTRYSLIFLPENTAIFLGLIGYLTLGHEIQQKNWSYMGGGSYSVGGSYIPVYAVGTNSLMDLLTLR